MKRRLMALGLSGIGIAGLCYAAWGQRLSPIGIVVAMMAFFAAANVISKVGKLADRLQPFIGKTGTAQAWAHALAGGEAFGVVSVRAIGAGLHIYLKITEGSPMHLKIAQPREVVITETRIEIGDAKYVQWGGHKLVRQPSAPALVIEAEK